MTSLKEALISNRDDTGAIARELGKLFEDLQRIEARLSKAHNFTSIAVPVSFICGLSAGCGGMLLGYGLYKHDTSLITCGGILAGVGVAGFAGAEIVFFVGKSPKFKIW